uniref:Transmembrane protein n=1 Tax=Marseillevirus LCMAC101 TaxID=2506602 RepID=A0A481YTQ2_9VIRU|nr:MAG: hypothetical protein LCMAC101_04790 [Marseillevirus LCMAC101]
MLYWGLGNAVGACVSTYLIGTVGVSFICLGEVTKGIEEVFDAISLEKKRNLSPIFRCLGATVVILGTTVGVIWGRKSYSFFNRAWKYNEQMIRTIETNLSKDETKHL